MQPLRVRVGDRDVVYDDPTKARADGTRAIRMARELGPETENEPAQVTEKRRELNARAKALHDWARRAEAAAPAAPKTEPAPAPAPAQPSPRSRRQAAAALTATGIRKGAGTARSTVKKTRVRTRRTVRRYEAAGGAPVSSLGEFATFFFGSLIALVLLEDALSQKGSAAFAKATTTATTIADRIISPVPIVSKGG